MATIIQPSKVPVSLHRIENTSEHTFGEMHVLGERFYIIERPWLDNRSNVSCIPTGVYTGLFMARSSSGKYKNVYWLQEVPNRGGILVHSGNLVKHSLGCLIIGLRAGHLGGKRAVLNSKTALHEFVELLDQRPILMDITGGN